MRDIKFRAWDKKLKAMMTGCGFLIGADGKFYVDSGWDDITASRHRYKDYTVMQYTGLKDKNRKEIYEGDIIKIENWSSKYKCKKCGYSSKKAGYVEIGFQNESITDYGNRSVARFSIKINGEEYKLDNVEDYEIIGNIYENPKLLKEMRHKEIYNG